MLFLSLWCRFSQGWTSSGQTWNFSKSSSIASLLMCCTAQVRGSGAGGPWGGGVRCAELSGASIFFLCLAHRQWIWGPPA